MIINHSSKLISSSPFRFRSRQKVAYCRFRTVLLYSSESLSSFGFTNPQVRVKPRSPSNCGRAPLCPYSSIATSSRPLSASGNARIGSKISKYSIIPGLAILLPHFLQAVISIPGGTALATLLIKCPSWLVASDKCSRWISLHCDRSRLRR